MIDTDQPDDKWKRQFRKGFLELAVLTAVEAQNRVYGFELLETLKSAGLDLSEGTLYPLLARLFSEKKLDAEWETPPTGHPRKFYRLSATGRAQLGAMAEEYEDMNSALKRLKGGSL
jgi:PadR family transcriptional regulator, regulatory protein PadR